MMCFCYKNDVYKFSLHRKQNRPSEANKTTSSLSQNPGISMNILIKLKTKQSQEWSNSGMTARSQYYNNFKTATDWPVLASKCNYQNTHKNYSN
jgi:hypothetical protein